MKDEPTFEDLSSKSKSNILSKTVSFQGKDIIVRSLIKRKNQSTTEFIQAKNDVIDLPAMIQEMDIIIPSFKISSHVKSYITRRLIFPLNSAFQAKLDKKLGVETECVTFSPKGKIEWLVQDEKKKEDVWGKMKSLLRLTLPTSSVQEQHLISEEETSRLIIITGVAGTGKSALLSHFYESIKARQPDDTWVIKINLVNHYKVLIKLEDKQENPFWFIDFFLGLSNVVDDQSSFSRLLLKHRLKTSDRIVVMFDGF